MRILVLSVGLVAAASPAASQYVRVSVSSAGVQANGHSLHPAISSDGRFVLFDSTASNLVSGDTNGVSDIFLHDRDTDTDGVYDEPGAISTRRLSVVPGGIEADGPSSEPIFAGPNWVAFLSRATNLVPDLTSPVQRVFAVNLITGDIRLVSKSTGGVAADSDCEALAVGDSSSGQYVAYRSLSRTLAPGDPGPGGAIFVSTIQPGSDTVRVSPPVHPDDQGLQPRLSAPTMTADGSLVGFGVYTTFPTSQASSGRLYTVTRTGFGLTDIGTGVALKFDQFGTSFVALDATGFMDGSTSRRLLPDGRGRRLTGPPTPLFFQVRVSASGRSAAFVDYTETTLFDFVSGQASTLPIGDQFGAAWSLDTRFLAVATTQSNLVTGDTNQATDVVVADLPRYFDADQDTLDDRWERLSGLDPTSAVGNDGASGDPDGDGQTNALEFATVSEFLFTGGITHPTAQVRRYLAEGAANAFFDTELALVNPDPTRAAAVQIRYRSSSNLTAVQPMLVPPLGRRTALPGALVGVWNSDFAIEVESDRPVVVDRRMTWDATGYGASLESARAAPSTTWYLAEGTTAADFSLFYLLYNPQATAVTATIRYLRPSGAPIVRTYDLAPASRTTIIVDTVDAALADSDVSGDIVADAPIVAERAMYATRHGRPFDLGTVSAGVTAPATEWFLAEGATGTFFDLYVLVANPSATEAAVDLHFLKPDGTEVLQTLAVPAGARRSVFVDSVPGLEGTPVATRVVSTNAVPIVVERAMYWPGGFYDYEEGHSAAGSAVTATRWALAEGENGGPRDAQSYVLIANAGATAAEARITLLGETLPNTSQFVPLPANSRVTVRVGANRIDRFGVLVESLGAAPAPLVVEGAYYWSPGGRTWAAGGNLLATPLTP